ncbi:sigma-70 family RNA polymerase sigma factor [bacterium]|nr:sigma-70 family RNA polymerase sigma factor [bacterium]
MTSNISEKILVNKKIKEYFELIEIIAKVEFKKMTSGYLIDYSELVNIGTQTVHNLITTDDISQYNSSYISTAIKWAIRNEVRRRYKWYALKSKKGTILDEEQRCELRETVYKTILSIEEMAENPDNPTLVKDTRRTPDQSIEFFELSEAVKDAIKKLPPREKELLEAKFYKDKKLRELAIEFDISQSRISRIIQSGLNRIRKELAKQGIIE